MPIVRARRAAVVVVGVAALSTLSLVAALPAAAAVPDTARGSVGGGRFSCATIHKWTDSTILAARCTISDTSKDGVGVYLQVKGVRAGAKPNSAWGRFTQNAPSQSSLRGNFATAPRGGSGGFTFYLVRMCQSRAGVADPCGAAQVIGE